MLPGPSERYVPVVESALDEDLDPHPCEEDEELFNLKSRPDAEEMEQAISKFLYVCTSIYWYVLVCTIIELFSLAGILVFLEITLITHVVGGTLTTIGCVEWESEQFRGVMRARCYQFKLPKRHFHGVNPQVYKLVYTNTYMYIHVHTSTY
jgi:hypothetical protein